MNTGQMMLTIAAMTLLSVLVLGYYRNIGSHGVIMGQSQAGLMASTLATSYRERILNSYFDEALKKYPYSSIVSNPDLLSYNLGPDGTNEISIDDFDDVDDFNNYTDTVKLPMGHFAANFNVYYVSPNNIDVPASTRTFLKRVEIKVWRTYPQKDTTEVTVFDTVRISTIKGMFKYDENDF
ncbi:MAG: hypothetical protein N3A63_10235 [Bacteroidetes bacterium]|nr:hypothetical protein [Bacteroidota bacterium]